MEAPKVAAVVWVENSKVQDFWPALLPLPSAAAQLILTTVRHCSILFIMTALPFYPNKLIYLFIYLFIVDV